MNNPRYLTKSRFKLALECETKLYYTRKKDTYADQDIDDPFLIALAEGGFQVGELAKYYFCEDPVKENITIKTLNYAEALKETNRRIEEGKKILAEAAVLFENLFIRVDIFKINKAGKQIDLIEVKSKSYDSDDNFLNKAGTDIVSNWEPYLYDVAFQKYVISKAFPGYNISSFLMLVNKGSIATVDGLNQFFKIIQVDDRSEVIIKTGLKRKDLGEEILINIPVDEEVQWLWENPVKTNLVESYSFEEYIGMLAEKYTLDKKINTPLDSHCKECQFYTKEEDKKKGLISGFKECWKEKAGLTEEELEERLVLDLWCGYMGSRNIRKDLILSKKYFLDQVSEEDIRPEKEKEYVGLSPHNRRMEQINKVKKKDEAPYLDKDGLKHEMEKWKWPLHFIDFETSMVAVPFNKDRRPYEGIAFQFSHHSVKGDKTIEHKGQFLKAETGVFPNYDFIRALREELKNDYGTVFRYHNHENTYLCMVYRQLMDEDVKNCPNKNELMEFIKSITKLSERNAQKYGIDPWKGNRNMVDLYDLVRRYYYPPQARGSISIKQILPSVIENSEYIRKKYSKPVYGHNCEIKSLNFDKKIWIDESKGNDPYKTLPKIFDECDEEQLDQLVKGFDEIREGGAALTAYLKLQFSEVPKEQRKRLKEGLLKYCELDTMAMVMIWEYWDNEINK